MYRIYPLCGSYIYVDVFKSSLLILEDWIVLSGIQNAAVHDIKTQEREQTSESH